MVFATKAFWLFLPAVLIAASSLGVTLLFIALGWWVERRTQAWRSPAGR